MQVIDVSANPPVVKASLVIPSNAVGNSIAYKNGYVYLGLKSSSSGPEFYIIDVHNPLSPQVVTGGHWPASGSLGHDINAIYIRNQYAYLAVPDTVDNKKLIVLDISNASGPKEVGSFSEVGANNGKSIALVGDTLYLGRTWGGTELSVLDVSNPATASPPVLGIDATINASVDAIVVRGKINPQNTAAAPALAFALTTSDLKILNVSDPASIASWGTKTFDAGTFGSIQFEPVLDCQGNNFYIGVTDDSDNAGSGNGGGNLYIVTP